MDTLDELDPAAVDAAAMDALRAVIDPELGVNIVDLGLVYECDVNDGLATVVMTTTTPACPIGSYLEGQVQWALLRVPGVDEIDVVLTHERRWTPALMSEKARAILGVTA